MVHGIFPFNNLVSMGHGNCIHLRDSDTQRGLDTLICPKKKNQKFCKEKETTNVGVIRKMKKKKKKN